MVTSAGRLRPGASITRGRRAVMARGGLAATAARQHREDEAALVVSQLAQDAHGKAVMAGPEGYSVTDRTDPRGHRAEADGTYQ
jgi:hypothetical protein